MNSESSGVEGTNVSIGRSSHQMPGMLDDPNLMTVLAKSLLASISDVTASVVRIDLEQETFMEIGCYIGRTSPAIMELQTSENAPPNATEILQSLSKSVDHAKYLVKKCATGASSIPNPEVRSIIEELEGVIRNMGESLSLIPSSTFREQEYAEIAVQSISRELRTAHFEISPVQVSETIEPKLEQLKVAIMGENLSSVPSSTVTEQEYAVQSSSREMLNAHYGVSPVQGSESEERKLQVRSFRHSPEGGPSFKKLPEAEAEAELTETDLYSVDVLDSIETYQSLDMPQVIDYLKRRNYIGQENSASSSRSRSLMASPQMSEYMEPLYETFYCPLSKKIMDDPVTVTSGVTYEKNAIAEWIKSFEDTAEDIICPITGQKLMCTVLNTNIALKTTIEEWKERNETARLKVARAALSLASSDSMILETLKDLQVLCQNRQYNKVQVRNIGMIPLLAQFMEHRNRKVRCAALETLQLLAEEDEEGKETIAKTNAITTTIKMLPSKHLPLRHASLCFLLELSTSKSLCEKIGSVTGGILMLITMKYNQSFDDFTAEKANTILRNLERSPANIKCMADNGLLEPLLNHLIEGSEETQMDMANYLADIVLGHDTKTYVAERASPILIKMVHSGNSLTRKAAFKALVQISSYQTNSRMLIEAGIVPIMIEEMFTRRIYDEPMNSKEESAAILASILDSGIALDAIQVNIHGHTMASDYIVYNLIQMLKNSTSDEINISLIKILLCLTISPKSTATIVSVVKETEASYTLIELINSPMEELGTATIKLLIILAPHMGHTLADRLCKTRGQPESLIKIPTETTRIREKHAVSVNFLAKLPHQNLPLNLALHYKDAVPTVIRSINEIQKSGTRTSKYANSYLEGLVGILVRFTATLYETQILQVARKHNFSTVFTELLMRTSTDEIQRLSAIGLENLSTESINLSKPPQIKKTKIMKLLHLPKSLSMGSSKQRKIQLCPIHKGDCSSGTTFCLLDAKAVERLLACLDHENSKVVEAALSAICTLLDDKVDVDKSISVLNEVNVVQHVLNLLKEHKEEGLRQKSFWLIERFLTKGGDRSMSDVSHDRSLPSTLLSAFHHGDGNTRQVAGKILKHLNRMPNYTTQFF